MYAVVLVDAVTKITPAYQESSYKNRVILFYTLPTTDLITF